MLGTGKEVQLQREAFPVGLQNPPPTLPSSPHVDVTSQCFTIPKDLFSIKTDIFSVWLYGKTWQSESELLYSGYGPGEINHCAC